MPGVRNGALAEQEAVVKTLPQTSGDGETLM
jgi:hypothetical protein